MADGNVTSDEDERQVAEERDGREHPSVARECDDEEEEESSEQEDVLNKGSDSEEKSEEEEERDEEEQGEENEQDEEDEEEDDDDDNSEEEDDKKTKASNVLANYSEKLQKALVGNLDGDFPENVKVVRIFTSSTFTGKYIKYCKVTPTVSARNLRYCGYFRSIITSLRKTQVDNVLN